MVNVYALVKRRPPITLIVDMIYPFIEKGNIEFQEEQQKNMSKKNWDSGQT